LKTFSSRILRYGVLAAVLWIGTACTPALSMETLDILIETAAGGSVAVRVEVAVTEAQQARGFMERRSIPDGTGMVFVYRTDRRMHFWMENTPSALSIAYIDSEGVIREIHELVPLSRQIVSSGRSVRYALEVPSGWFERAGIVPGDQLSTESVDALARRSLIR